MGESLQDLAPGLYIIPRLDTQSMIHKRKLNKFGFIRIKHLLCERPLKIKLKNELQSGKNTFQMSRTLKSSKNSMVERNNSIRKWVVKEKRSISLNIDEKFKHLYRCLVS